MVWSVCHFTVLRFYNYATQHNIIHHIITFVVASAHTHLPHASQTISICKSSQAELFVAECDGSEEICCSHWWLKNSAALSVLKITRGGKGEGSKECRHDSQYHLLWTIFHIMLQRCLRWNSCHAFHAPFKWCNIFRVIRY